MERRTFLAALPAIAAALTVRIGEAAAEVPALGTFPLPIEVVTFAQALLAERIAACGASVVLRKDGTGRPYVTDEGHHILDCSFGLIPEPGRLADELDHIPGVVEHGLFLDLADVVLIGKGSEVIERHRQQPRPPRPLMR